MTNVYNFTDDKGHIHWFLHEQGTGDKELQMWLKGTGAEAKGWPVKTYIQDADNDTLASLAEFLFDEYNDDDGLMEYLLRRFKGDAGDFADFLVENMSQGKAKEVKNELARRSMR